MQTINWDRLVDAQLDHDTIEASHIWGGQMFSELTAEENLNLYTRIFSAHTKFAKVTEFLMDNGVRSDVIDHTLNAQTEMTDLQMDINEAVGIPRAKLA